MLEESTYIPFQDGLLVAPYHKEEFATYNDSLEEVFENKEQIEVSKFYEKLPKPHALAVQEWLDGKIYHRDANK